MNDAQLPTVSAGLSPEEANFVYNTEVLGLPVKKAVAMSGMAPDRVSKPHIIQAREQAKRALRGAVGITKEDSIHGIRDAIWRAQLLSEPSTEIRGWEVINKMLGFDAPTRVDVNINETVRVVREQAKGLSDSELAQMLGADDVIDADFYEVGEE